MRDVLEASGFGGEVYPSAEAFLADPVHCSFKCIILDINLPGMSGMELQAKLKLQSDSPRIIFLTGSTDLSIVVRALQNGAADFLRKPVEGLPLLQSVTRALRQERIERNGSVQRADLDIRRARLTRREREIMERVARGELNKNIAVDLGISERTIEHHRQSVMRKMGAKSLAALIRMLA